MAQTLELFTNATRLTLARVYLELGELWSRVVPLRFMGFLERGVAAARLEKSRFYSGVHTHGPQWALTHSAPSDAPPPPVRAVKSYYTVQMTHGVCAWRGAVCTCV